jgi:hypothetical protein
VLRAEGRACRTKAHHDLALSALSRYARREAIVEVAGHRKHDVVSLAEALAGMPDRQLPCTAMAT